jgi:4,5-dihydroxyphthalate decarboxylase
LDLACGSYDRTRELMDGTVQIEGVELNYISLGPIELFWRMLNNMEFDVSDMSLSSYTIMPVGLLWGSGWP